MSLITWIIGSLILLALIDWLRMLKWKRKYLIGIPGPTYIPLVGNLLDFPSFADFPSVGFKYIYKYGQMVLVHISCIRYLVVCDPKWIEIITTSTNYIKKAPEYNMLHRWLGDGLLTSGGDKWRKARKFLTPAFHFNNLDQFVNCFNNASDVLIEKLQEQVGKVIDIYPFITLCTLDIICESIMGISVNAQNEKNSKYVESVHFMSDLLYRRVYSVWKMIDYLYPLSVDYWKEKAALKILHGTTDSVIQKRRVYLLENPDYVNKNLGKCTSFLDMLLMGTIDGRPLTDLEIREQVDTFLFEGHDTTSTAISFTLIALAMHPEVQEKVFQEIKTVMGEEKNLRFTNADILELKYLNAVVKEALRLYPPVPLFGRTLEQEVVHDGIVFPKGLSVIMIAGYMQREASIFSDPEKFIPERFLNENWHGTDPYTYIPFSAGFRNCIGKKFALLEVNTIIAKIVRNFKLSKIDGYLPRIKISIVIKTKDGFPVKLEARE